MYRSLHSVHSAQFGGQFFGLRLLQLGNASHRLWTQDVASPVTQCAAYLIVSVVVVGPDGFHQLSQRALVFPTKAEGKRVTGLSYPSGEQSSIFSSQHRPFASDKSWPHGLFR
uniref:Uncharacterized protein n=1 Tax=Catagonus wagneri TaxID=51154 RepID=A0A8C3WCK5_9CETA